MTARPLCATCATATPHWWFAILGLVYLVAGNSVGATAVGTCADALSVAGVLSQNCDQVGGQVWLREAPRTISQLAPNMSETRMTGLEIGGSSEAGLAACGCANMVAGEDVLNGTTTSVATVVQPPIYELRLRLEGWMRPNMTVFSHNVVPGFTFHYASLVTTPTRRVLADAMTDAVAALALPTSSLFARLANSTTFAQQFVGNGMRILSETLRLDSLQPDAMRHSVVTRIFNGDLLVPLEPHVRQTAMTTPELLLVKPQPYHLEFADSVVRGVHSTLPAPVHAKLVALVAGLVAFGDALPMAQPSAALVARALQTVQELQIHPPGSPRYLEIGLTSVLTGTAAWFTVEANRMTAGNLAFVNDTTTKLGLWENATDIAQGLAYVYGNASTRLEEIVNKQVGNQKVLNNSLIALNGTITALSGQIDVAGRANDQLLADIKTLQTVTDNGFATASSNIDAFKDTEKATSDALVSYISQVASRGEKWSISITTAAQKGDLAVSQQDEATANLNAGSLQLAMFQMGDITNGLQRFLQITKRFKLAEDLYTEGVRAFHNISGVMRGMGLQPFVGDGYTHVGVMAPEPVAEWASRSPNRAIRLQTQTVVTGSDTFSGSGATNRSGVMSVAFVLEATTLEFWCDPVSLLLLNVLPATNMEQLYRLLDPMETCVVPVNSTLSAYLAAYKMAGSPSPNPDGAPDCICWVVKSSTRCNTYAPLAPEARVPPRLWQSNLRPLVNPADCPVGTPGGCNPCGTAEVATTAPVVLRSPQALQAAIGDLTCTPPDPASKGTAVGPIHVFSDEPWQTYVSRSKELFRTSLGPRPAFTLDSMHRRIPMCSGNVVTAAAFPVQTLATLTAILLTQAWPTMTAKLPGIRARVFGRIDNDITARQVGHTFDPATTRYLRTYRLEWVVMAPDDGWVPIYRARLVARHGMMQTGVPGRGPSFAGATDTRPTFKRNTTAVRYFVPALPVLRGEFRLVGEPACWTGACEFSAPHTLYDVPFGEVRGGGAAARRGGVNYLASSSTAATPPTSYTLSDWRDQNEGEAFVTDNIGAPASTYFVHTVRGPSPSSTDVQCAPTDPNGSLPLASSGSPCELLEHFVPVAPGGVLPIPASVAAVFDPTQTLLLVPRVFTGAGSVIVNAGTVAVRAEVVCPAVDTTFATLDAQSSIQVTNTRSFDISYALRFVFNGPASDPDADAPSANCSVGAQAAGNIGNTVLQPGGSKVVRWVSPCANWTLEVITPHPTFGAAWVCRRMPLTIKTADLATTVTRTAGEIVYLQDDPQAAQIVHSLAVNSSEELHARLPLALQDMHATLLFIIAAAGFNVDNFVEGVGVMTTAINEASAAAWNSSFDAGVYGTLSLPPLVPFNAQLQLGSHWSALTEKVKAAGRVRSDAFTAALDNVTRHRTQASIAADAARLVYEAADAKFVAVFKNFSDLTAEIHAINDTLKNCSSDVDRMNGYFDKARSIKSKRVSLGFDIFGVDGLGGVFRFLDDILKRIIKAAGSIFGILGDMFKSLLGKLLMFLLLLVGLCVGAVVIYFCCCAGVSKLASRRG